MAMQVAQSGLAKRYGGRLDAAVQKHAHDETDYGFQRLPAGIKNGVAQLTKLYFEQYKKGTLQGEYYLRGEAVVVYPIMHRLPDGSEMKIAGLTTSLMRPICETKNSKGEVTTLGENAAEIMNEFRKLGGQTSEMTMGSELESLAAAIQQARPYFRFTTTETTSTAVDPKTGKPYAPRTWENWNGCEGLENYTPPDASATAVQDDTTAATNESDVAESTGVVAVNGTHTASETQAPVEYTDQGDIESVITKACEGDADAQKELQLIAHKLGLQDQVDAADSWDSAAEIVRGAYANTATTEEAQVEETPVKPDVVPKTMYKYKPQVKGPGGKMVPGKKAVDVEVVTSDKAKRTAVVKNMVDGKTKYTVSWDELE